MIKTTLAQAAAMSQSKLIQAYEPETSIEGVSIDSRSIVPGNLYVPLAGARANGHDFIEQVKEAGAAASFWQKDRLPYPQGIPLLLCEDPLEAMQQLAKSYLAKVRPYTVGVTGSNGKTSTKDLAASVFSQEKKTWKTQGNHNNEIGLPLTILEMDKDTEVLILEMGMENPGDILFLCQMAPLDAAIVVSIGSAHMENFGSRQAIAQGKMEIAQGLVKNGLLVWNADSPELCQIVRKDLDRKECRCVSFGKNGDVRREDSVGYTRQGIAFKTNALEGEVFVKALGDVQADNALSVIALAQDASLHETSIRKGLQEAQMTKMRNALIPAGKALILDDSYKSNPESAAQALDTLMKLPARKHIAVLADMLDLGQEEKLLHEQTGALAKNLKADALYAYGPRGKWIAQGFGPQALWFESQEKLIQALEGYLQEDAAILIKGSRAMAMDKVTDTLIKKAETLVSEGMD